MFNNDKINSPSNLTKEEILSTNDWCKAGYINLIEEYFWKHKNKENDGYNIYMVRQKNDGFTKIILEDKEDDDKLFEGYIKNIFELNQVVHLLRLRDIM
jgi:hypothetical protein